MLRCRSLLYFVEIMVLAWRAEVLHGSMDN